MAEVVDALIGAGAAAIFCVSDVLAFRAYEALHKMGLTVPADVELVGFGNRDGIENIHPRVTTVVLPSYEMGRRAAEVLFSKIDDVSFPRQRIELPTELVISGDLPVKTRPASRVLVYA